MFLAASYLGKRGMCFCGNEHKDGAYINLEFTMAEAHNDRDVIQWLNGQNNEIIKIFSDTIYRIISDELSKSLFFGIVADGTPHILLEWSILTCTARNEKYVSCILQST